MSHANGEVWSQDGSLLGYYEYNGTSDVACTRIYSTFADMHKNWRGDNMRRCSCKGKGQSVILYSDYGCGFHWAGRACLKCMAITEGAINPLEDVDGHPFREKEESNGPEDRA